MTQPFCFCEFPVSLSKLSFRLKSLAQNPQLKISFSVVFKLAWDFICWSKYLFFSNCLPQNTHRSEHASSGSLLIAFLWEFSTFKYWYIITFLIVAVRVHTVFWKFNMAFTTFTFLTRLHVFLKFHQPLYFFFTLFTFKFSVVMSSQVICQLNLWRKIPPTGRANEHFQCW